MWAVRRPVPRAAGLFLSGRGPLACRSKRFSGRKSWLVTLTHSIAACWRLPWVVVPTVSPLDPVGKGGKAEMGPAQGLGCDLHRCGGASGTGYCGEEGARPVAAMTNEHRCALDHLSDL